MPAEIIDGRVYARRLRQEVAFDVERLRASGVACRLATIMMGSDYSAHAYEHRLAKVADTLGVSHVRHRLPATATEEEVLELLEHLGEDPGCSAVLVLRPLPPHIREHILYTALDPLKDIESVHPENAGLLALGTPRYVPSTPASVFHLLDAWLDQTGHDRADFYHSSTIAVVGRSNNVGKPAVWLGAERGAVVISCDEWASHCGRLGEHTRQADVLVVAAGVPRLIHGEHVAPGAVVLDVGINPVTDSDTGVVRLVGDVDHDAVALTAGALTPVPGGVGPVTDVWLLRNTALAAEAAAKRR